LEQVQKLQQVSLVLKAAADPVFFATHPFFLGLKLYPKQAEILREFYKGSYSELILVAGMRCTTSNTLIVDTSTGRLVSICEQPSSIPTFGSEIRSTSNFTLIKQGIRDVYKVETYSGRVVEVTENQPFLTPFGERELRQLKVGDYIALARSLPYFGNKHCPLRARVLALTLAEGCLRSCTTFSNRDPEILKAFKEALMAEFGSELVDLGNSKDYRIKHGTFRAEMKRLKLFNELSKNKFVPDEVFEYDRDSLREFLYWYWRGDGGLEESPYYYSSSETLLRQIQHLLLRFGIRSILRCYKAMKRKGFEAYYLKVLDDFSIIAPEITYKRKSSANSPIDKLPFKKADLRRILNISNYKMDKLVNSTINCRNHLTIYTLRKLAKNLDHPWLKLVTEPSIYWEPITKIEYCGKKETYDYHVPETGWYIGNDIVLHNSGKTFLSAVFALYEAFRLLILPDPAEHYGLAPGSKIFIVAVAVSEDQARDTVFSEILAKVRHSPFFRQYNPKAYETEIRFNKPIVILCGTSSSASLVGRSVKVAIFDELARFEQSTSKRGAKNVYTSLSRGTTTFGLDGKVIVISSVQTPTDLVMQLYEQSKTQPEMLGVKCPTWEFNPNLPFDSPKLQAELKKDPAAFWRDYGCEPSFYEQAYYGNQDIIYVNEERPNIFDLMKEGFDLEKLNKYIYCSQMYVLAGDQSFKHDSFGFCIAYHDLNSGKYIVPGLKLLTPPKKGEVDPFKVRDFIFKCIDLFPISTVVFDMWNYPEVISDVRKRGIPVVIHHAGKAEHDRVKELFYSRKLDICNYPELVRELKQLQLKASGKVDHLPRGRKDVADALANAIWGLDNSKRSQIPINVVVTV